MLIKRKVIKDYVERGQLISKQVFIDAVSMCGTLDFVSRKAITSVLTEAFCDDAGLIAEFVSPGVNGMTVFAPDPKDGYPEEYNLYDAADLYWMVASIWVIQFKKDVPRVYREMGNFDIAVEPWYTANEV